MYMKETGSQTRPMVKENTLMLTEQSIKVTGMKIDSKAMVLRDGQMERNTRESTTMARSMEEANSAGLMVLVTMESLKTTQLKATASMNGLMAEDMKARGRAIRWMAKVHSAGKTEESTKEIIWTIRNMDMASLTGQMEEDTKDTGKMENNTVKGLLSERTAREGKVNGRMESEQNGLMDLLNNWRVCYKNNLDKASLTSLSGNLNIFLKNITQAHTYRLRSLSIFGYFTVFRS
mmetsp:Transcript_35447/g.41347  ORF Transcript_35447/g.41347 Transcript_35447/m.41347 type:complete len:234 (+) Transcript_35447:55-756(+)